MKLLRVFKVLCMVCAAGLVLGFVVEHLWNWLMTSIFGLRTITFWQAVGLLVLSKILMGGFHRHGRGRERWKQRMERRFAQMTPEERMRFREGMRGCGWGRHAHHDAPSVDHEPVR